MNAISNININGIISKLKDHAEQFRGTELEKKVKEATSNANWGVTFQVKEDIARATYDYQSYSQVMGIIWKRMGESGKNWKMVFKSLDLLEYLLKRGSERVIAEAQGRQYQIRTLRDFHFSEADGRDKGGGIREKSRSICELLNDKSALDAERAKARSQVGKYMGISHYDSFGSSSSFNRHRTSAQYDPDYTFRDQRQNDAGGTSEVEKKKKKKKKKAPKPENELSDDVLSDSDTESRRPSRLEYNIPEPNAPDDAKKRRKKKKDKAKRDSLPASKRDSLPASEPSPIADLLSGAFSGSAPDPHQSQSPAPADPFTAFDFSINQSTSKPPPSQAFDFSTPSKQPSSQAFDLLFTETSSQPSFAPSNDPFQDLLQTPSAPSRPSPSFQQQPSFTPGPLFASPEPQPSLFSPSTFIPSPSGNPNFANFPTESDHDDWGFVSAQPTPQQTQIDFFNTPVKPNPSRSDPIWDDFSTLSLSSPPYQR